jgi:hypothetical protein
MVVRYVHLIGNGMSRPHERVSPPMSTLDAMTPSPDAAQTHRLLSLLTVTGLQLGMLQRELAKDGSSASAKTRILVERLAQGQRAMIDELRPPRRDA